MSIGACVVEETRIGFMVKRDGEPVPAQVHPPMLLAFDEREHADAYAAAIDAGDAAEAHRLIAEHGSWWA